VTVSLRGVLAPVITPFDRETGELSREGLERNLAAHLAGGVHGIVLAGSTGEAVLLDDAERTQLTEWARSIVPRDRLLIAGVGSESTRTTIRLAKNAAAAGADAVMVVAPHYYGGTAMTATALSAHFLRVAESSPVPIILYNIPKYMHYSLPPQLVSDLAPHANIIGIKDSSGDRDLLSVYLNAARDDFAVMTGSAGLLTKALQMGAGGGIIAAATLAPKLAREVHDAAAARDFAGAASGQEVLASLGTEIVAALGVAGIKAAHDMIGLHGGDPRMPLEPLGATDSERLRSVIERHSSRLG
jgi:4-hydroxy-2-oxoglutarate aldolase